MICTFFGHRNVTDRIQPILHKTLSDLIENNGVDTFYIGNQGEFDHIVIAEMRKLKVSYPHIKYFIVLAYMPGKKDPLIMTDYSNTIYPEGLETVPRKYAIDKRNRIMIQWSDIVITYVYHSGGAEKFKMLAEKAGKKVINLIEQDC